MKIDPHDIEIRLDQARRFLMEGHKVQIVQNFRGREMAHKERGRVRMKQIIETLSDVGKVEMEPRFAGRRITMVIGPDRPKIERLKRQAAAQKLAAGAEAEAEAESEAPPPAEPASPEASETAKTTDATQPVPEQASEVVPAEGAHAGHG